MKNQVRKYLTFLPLLIITATMIHCLYTVNTTDTVFQSGNYIGLVIVLSGLLLLFFNKRLSRLSTLLGLVIATFNLAAFTPVITYLSFGARPGTDGVRLTIQPYSLLILLLFVFLNEGVLRKPSERKS